MMLKKLFNRDKRCYYFHYFSRARHGNLSVQRHEITDYNELEVKIKNLKVKKPNDFIIITTNNIKFDRYMDINELILSINNEECVIFYFDTIKYELYVKMYGTVNNYNFVKKFNINIKLMKNNTQLDFKQNIGNMNEFYDLLQ